MNDYDIFTLGYDTNLSRNTLSASLDSTVSLPDVGGYAGGIGDLTDVATTPGTLVSGGLSTSLNQVGILYNGKTSFTDTTNGFRQGIDSSDGLFKWVMGTTGSMIDWNVTTANTLTITGTIVASSGTIGGFTIGATDLTATSGGNTTTLSSGSTAFSAGPTGSPTVTITQAGAATFSNITATGTINATGGYIGSATALVYESQGINTGITGYIRGGQTDYSTGTGYFLGYSGGAYKFSIGDGGTSYYMNWNGTTLTVNGRTFASEAQYGDGSDGDVTISVDTTLARDMFYNNLTVNSTKILHTAGYRIFVKGTLTVNGQIERNGNAGTNGTNGNDGTDDGGAGGTGGAAGTTGAALSAGTLPGTVASGSPSAGTDGGASGGGSSSGSSAGTNGTAQTNVVIAAGKNGAQGGQGGDTSAGTSGTPGAAGTAGAATLSQSKPFTAHTGIIMIDTTGGTVAMFQTSSGAGGSSGGTGGAGGNNGGSGGGGGGGGGAGGSGSCGGIIVISAKTIVVGAAGSITANGGAAGNGGNGGQGGDSATTKGDGGGGGAAGAAGNGGLIVLIYSSLTNGGTISANAGAQGTAGSGGAAGGGAGLGGAAGAAGNVPTAATAGTVVQLQNA